MIMSNTQKRMIIGGICGFLIIPLARLVIIAYGGSWFPSNPIDAGTTTLLFTYLGVITGWLSC
jgi:hypothetical protein